jgi:hypothetical protein
VYCIGIFSNKLDLKPETSFYYSTFDIFMEQQKSDNGVIMIILFCFNSVSFLRS